MASSCSPTRRTICWARWRSSGRRCLGDTVATMSKPSCRTSCRKRSTRRRRIVGEPRGRCGIFGLVEASVWTGARRGQVARVAAHRRCCRGRVAEAAGVSGQSEGGRVQGRAAARDGRVEPRAGGVGADVRRRRAGFPTLHILDSTDPAQIKALRAKVDLSEDAVHREQQVGQHARAEYLQGAISGMR